MVWVSPHFSSSCGIPRDGEMFSCRGWGMVWKFQNGESFSPFLLISWDSVRFIQTQPPPQDFSSRYANADPIWVPWGKWVLRELEAMVLHDDYEAELYGGGTQTNRTIYHWARLQFWLKIKLKAGLQAWGINLVLLNTDIHSIIVLLIGEGPNPIT